MYAEGNSEFKTRWFNIQAHARKEYIAVRIDGGISRKIFTLTTDDSHLPSSSPAVWEFMHKRLSWNSTVLLNRCKCTNEAIRLVSSTACGIVFRRGAAATNKLVIPES